MNEIIEKEEAETDKEQEPEILDADCLRALACMTSSQLRAIYKDGKRKVKLANDPDVYRTMSCMTSSQLRAIFGED